VELQEDYEAISGLDAEILAVSVDSLRGAQRAIESIGLEFQILSDPDAEVVSAYGVWNLFQNELPAPSTFIIDKDGVIQWEYIASNSTTDRADNDEIIAQLQQLS
jgi:peroxiredoxin